MLGNEALSETALGESPERSVIRDSKTAEVSVERTYSAELWMEPTYAASVQIG